MDSATIDVLVLHADLFAKSLEHVALRLGFENLVGVLGVEHVGDDVVVRLICVTNQVLQGPLNIWVVGFLPGEMGLCHPRLCPGDRN